MCFFCPCSFALKKICLYSSETENIIDYCPQLSDGQNDTVDFGLRFLSSIFNFRTSSFDLVHVNLQHGISFVLFLTCERATVKLHIHGYKKRSADDKHETLED